MKDFIRNTFLILRFLVVLILSYIIAMITVPMVVYHLLKLYEKVFM